MCLVQRWRREDNKRWQHYRSWMEIPAMLARERRETERSTASTEAEARDAREASLRSRDPAISPVCVCFFDGSTVALWVLVATTHQGLASLRERWLLKLTLRC